MARVVVKSEDLLELIRAEAAKYPDECNDAYFGGVYWHEPDEIGCNWSISMIRGRDWSGCLERLHQFAIGLRGLYNIQNPSKGIDYLCRTLYPQLVSVRIRNAQDGARLLAIQHQIRLVEQAPNIRTRVVAGHRVIGVAEQHFSVFD